jgi:hypothetical protein
MQIADAGDTRHVLEQIASCPFCPECWRKPLPGGKLEAVLSSFDPTGSGKTLAAFLIRIDSLICRARIGDLPDRTDIVY